MRAEIVLTGTELLLGEIVDTNSMMVAKMLREIGLNLHYKTTVGDNEGRITEVLRHALERVDFVIVSGGLGPTVDDVTRQAAATATDCQLVYSPELEAQIRDRFRKFGREMAENNKRQAWIPEGAIPVENPVGTAPCFISETEQGSIICLPGVPHELKYQMKRAIIPYLKEKIGETQIIKARILRTVGIGESRIDREIDDLMRGSNPTVGLAAHLGQVDVRITAKADTEAEANALIDPLEAEIRNRLGHKIFGVDKETLPNLVGNLLRQQSLQLSIVDALTESRLATELEAAGFSDVIAGLAQFESPAEAVKQLDAAEFNGNVSGETNARRLAEQASDNNIVGVSILGPVTTQHGHQGSVITLAHQGRLKVKQYQYGYDGHTGKQWLTVQLLDQIRRWLQG